MSGDGRLPLRKDGQYWILAEDAKIPQLKVYLSLPEATALYIAGRLLSQIHDEHNRYVILALAKLTNALPQPLQIHQRTLIEMAQQRQQGQIDRSDIFEALTMGGLQVARSVCFMHHHANGNLSVFFLHICWNHLASGAQFMPLAKVHHRVSCAHIS